MLWNVQETDKKTKKGFRYDLGPFTGEFLLRFARPVSHLNDNDFLNTIIF